MNVSSGSKAFLCNQHNKEQLISLLSARLQNCGYETVECSGDADTSVEKKTYEYAKDLEVVISAEDSDILVLLLLFIGIKTCQSSISTECKDRKSKVKLMKFWDVGALAAKAPLREYILFEHAWGGCDTTSVTWRKDKTKILQSLRSSGVQRLAA